MSQALIHQIIVILLLVCVGYIARRVGIITQQTQMGLSAIVLNIAVPSSILSAANRPFESQNLMHILFVLLGAVIFHAASILLATLLSKHLKISSEHRTLFVLLITFANTSFLGYPVVAIFSPENGVFFASFYVLVFNIFFFTYATSKTSGQKKLSPSAIFGNINTIAAMLMVVLYITQIRLPSPVQSTLQLLGGLATPLSMLVIGSMLATIRLRQLFATPALYLVAFLRLLAAPLLTFTILKFLGVSGDVATVLLIMSSLPCASMTVMAAQRNNFSPEFATKGVLLTTILFVCTLPLTAFLHTLL